MNETIVYVCLLLLFLSILYLLLTIQSLENRLEEKEKNDENKEKDEDKEYKEEDKEKEYYTTTHPKKLLYQDNITKSIFTSTGINIEDGNYQLSVNGDMEVTGKVKMNLGYLQCSAITEQNISRDTIVSFPITETNTFGSNLTKTIDGTGHRFTNTSGKTQTWSISYTLRYKDTNQGFGWILLKNPDKNYYYAESSSSHSTRTDIPAVSGSCVLQIQPNQYILIMAWGDGKISANTGSEIWFSSILTIQQLPDNF